jgi:uncharacterized protein
MLSERIVQTILSQFALPIDGPHGLMHWARVLENAERLAEGLDVNHDVLELFAIFHDSRRISDGLDRDHGQRGADFAMDCRGLLYNLPDQEVKLLYDACAGHDDNRHNHDELTVRICWDAERLDLYRLGINPRACQMSTAMAREAGTMAWASASVNRSFNTAGLMRHRPSQGSRGMRA